MAVATLEITVQTQPLTFWPQRQQLFLNDDNRDDILIFFGEVDCPGCLCRVEVSAPIEGASGYCPNCAAHIPVEPDSHYLRRQHMRMDDSRPASTGRGCICGDALCPCWGAS